MVEVRSQQLDYGLVSVPGCPPPRRLAILVFSLEVSALVEQQLTRNELKYFVRYILFPCLSNYSLTSFGRDARAFQ